MLCSLLCNYVPRTASQGISKDRIGDLAKEASGEVGASFSVERSFYCWQPERERERDGGWGGRVAKELIFDCRGAGRAGQQAGSLFSQPTLTFEC